MESNMTSKIRLYIFALAALAFLMIILIVAIASVGLSKASNTNEQMISDISQPNQDLQQMQLYLGKIRVLIRDLAVNTESSIIGNTKKEIEDSMVAFESSLNIYTKNMVDMGDYEVSDRINGVSQLLQEYKAVTMKIIEMRLANDFETMKVIIAEQEVILGTELIDRLQELSYFNHGRSMASVHYSVSMSNSTIVMLIVCAIIAFSLILIVSIFLRTAILKILDSFAYEQKTKENLYIQDKRSNGNDANLLLSEFAKHISELKVVTYDLSKLARERKW